MSKNGSRKSSKNKRKEHEKDDALGPSISADAMRGVAAILSVAVAVFLALAAFGIGGTIGEHVYRLLSMVLGIGYFLFPLSLFLLAIALFRSFEKRFGTIQMGSIIVFLLASLSLIAIVFPGRSGLLGDAVARPLVALVDTPAAVVFLLAFVVAAIVVAFDVNLAGLLKALGELFRKPADEIGMDENVKVEAMDPDDEEGSDGEPAVEASTPEEPKERAPRIRPAAIEEDSAAAGGFPIAARASTYEPPPLSLLGKNKGRPEVGDVKANMNIIKRTLQNFGIQVEMDEVSIGPTVTRYAMKPAEGVRLAKIVALQTNLELALAASPVRIEAPIPGKSLVGIEVPNVSRTTLGLAPLLADPGYTQSEKPLLLALGRSISGAAQFADLARMPHTLVAGTTGAGKSVAIHALILSLLYRCGPERLRFIMVDPKRVELTLYNSIPHLLTPVITEPKKAILALKWLVKEMERRYSILETERVRDISSYHQNVVAPALKKATGEEGEQLPEAMPYIVIIIDELADIMQTYPRELEAGIVRLAQMSRAVGIHLVLSTQRPSVKVITGLIKANIPARIAFQVASQIDSRTILDQGGAEKLLGAGDMLFLSGEMPKPVRLQGPYTSEREVKEVVAYIAKQSEGDMPDEIDFEGKKGEAGGPDAIFASMSDDDDDDELYAEAKAAVMEAGKASTSYLQRKLGIGYSRAARLIDALEQKGVIGPGDGAKPREVLGARDDSASDETPDEERG